MNSCQANALKRLQVQLGVVKHEARNDLNFAQQLRAIGLFNCKLEYSALTIAHVLENNTPDEKAEMSRSAQTVNDMINAQVNEMPYPNSR